MSVVGIKDFKPEEHAAPRPVPAKLAMAAKALTAIGVLSLIGAAVMDPTRARLAVLVNIVYFAGITFGGMAFCAGMTLTLARWSRPLKRFAESFILFAPILVVIYLLFYLTGGFSLYEWVTHPETLHGHKASWLQEPFMLVREVIALSLLSLLGLAYVRNSLRPDLGLASRIIGDKAPGWWSNITAGFGDLEEETRQAQRKMMALAPLMGAGFAVIMSMFAIDTVMSLSHHWYANMFPGWYFMSCFWLAMVIIGLTSLGFRGWLGVGKYLKPYVYHDLGKLIFGFTMFWAYTFYAQLLPIWYGNMTEEIGFLLVRLSLEPWTYLTRIVGTMCFLIPFLTLLSRGIKKLPMGFAGVLSIIAVGLWLERFLVSVPSVWHEASIPLGPMEIGITMGFLGAFLWVVTWYLSSVPAMPLTDPYLAPNPMDVHVHSRDAVAAHH